MLFENISKTNIYLDFRKIESIIFNELNPVNLKIIKSTLEKLVEARPEYFNLLKRWLEKYKI